MSAFQVNGSPRAYIASSLRERTSTVHPHACGEHFGYAGSSQITCGSSPRMWGTRPAVRAVVERERFIPTHVGNTGCPGARPGVPPVHPHARGEHNNSLAKCKAAGGSSPRTWGTHLAELSMPLDYRFIPTRVGNTAVYRPVRPGVPVHPHARGEHTSPVVRFAYLTGSSPRTWGTPEECVMAVFELRFIPTHVGNTNSLLSRRLPSAGSSPRTWGTLFDGPPERNEPRFIPTHVGNTSNWPSTSYRPTVHPHARGEHTGQLPPVGNVIGSSPRTWGTPASTPTSN